MNFAAAPATSPCDYTSSTSAKTNKIFFLCTFSVLFSDLTNFNTPIPGRSPSSSQIIRPTAPGSTRSRSTFATTRQFLPNSTRIRNRRHGSTCRRTQLSSSRVRATIKRFRSRLGVVFDLEPKRPTRDVLAICGSLQGSLQCYCAGNIAVSGAGRHDIESLA